MSLCKWYSTTESLKYFVQEKMGKSNVSEESSLYTDVNWRTVEKQ